MAKAIARAQALETLGKAIGREHGSKAASLSVAEQYVQAFSQLAKSTNTLLLPEKTGDISSMVAQVSVIYSDLSSYAICVKLTIPYHQGLIYRPQGEKGIQRYIFLPKCNPMLKIM